MICSPCRKAGSLNSQAVPGMPHVEKLIRSMHKDCRGGTWCDCQHVLGKVLNMARLVKPDNSPEGIPADHGSE